MSDRLPHPLTRGVTATREGLAVRVSSLGYAVLSSVCPSAYFSEMENIFKWSDAAERLRYRDGEPWCTDFDGAILCEGPKTTLGRGETPLHRIAAMLCDGAEAFRTLHWCVTELGGKDE